MNTITCTRCLMTFRVERHVRGESTYCAEPLCKRRFTHARPDHNSPVRCYVDPDDLPVPDTRRGVA